MLMGSRLAPEMERRVMAELLEKATSLAVNPGQEPVPRAMQRVARRPVAENRPEQAKPDRDSPERPGLGLRARR
jgi:hypothetical protein